MENEQLVELAKFMGARPNVHNNNQYISSSFPNAICIEPYQMKYHTSWDWIMPVWEKFRMNVWQTTGYTKEFDEWKEKFMEAVFNNSCQSAAITMINAIKWYHNERS